MGPILALVTLLLMLFHPTPVTPFLALSMLFGLPACWYFKKWGAIFAVFVLTLVIFFNSTPIAADRFWHMGLVISILFTLFVTTNSSEESETLIEEFSGHSSTTQNTIDQHHIELANLNSKHQNELNSLQKGMEALAQELKFSQENSRNLLDSIEQAEQELQTAKNDFEQAKNEVERAKSETEIIKRELESQTIKEEHVLQELLDKRKEVFLLRDQLQEAQDELQKRPLDIASRQDASQNEHLRELLSRKEQDIFNLQFRLDSALEDIKNHEKELFSLQDEENGQKKIQVEMLAQLEALKAKNELLGFTVHKLQHENEMLISVEKEKLRLETLFETATKEIETLRAACVKAEQIVSEHSIPAPLSKELSNLNLEEENTLRRRAEGMFQQLKEQFQEKSNILDETRRQLFYTEEKLLLLQKNTKELAVFSPNPQAHYLIQHILKMQRHFDHTEKQYDAEINTLHGIIHKLNHSKG